MAIMPLSNFNKTRSLELHNVQGKIISDPVLIKSYLSGEARHLDQLHVVDERAAMFPGVVTVAVQGLGRDLLDTVVTTEGLSKHVNCVINQGCLRLKCKIHVVTSLHRP